MSETASNSWSFRGARVVVLVMVNTVLVTAHGQLNKSGKKKKLARSRLRKEHTHTQTRVRFFHVFFFHGWNFNPTRSSPDQPQHAVCDRRPGMCQKTIPPEVISVAGVQGNHDGTRESESFKHIPPQ